MQWRRNCLQALYTEANAQCTDRRYRLLELKGDIALNYSVLIAVLVYEVVSIVGVGLFLSYKNKHKKSLEGNFAFAGGNLSAGLMGTTLALTLLGSAHNWGTAQNAGSMGVIAVWFGIACVVMMVVITQFTGPWMRRTGAKTSGEFLGKIFGSVSGRMISSMNAALLIGMCCLEIETIAVTLSSLTGWGYTICAVVGGAFAVLYVLLAGMKEIAWLNVINAVVMYVALIAVFICLCFSLPDGWDGVHATFESSAETSWMTSIFGNSALIIGFAIPSALVPRCSMAWRRPATSRLLRLKITKPLRGPSGLPAPLMASSALFPL